MQVGSLQEFLDREILKGIFNYVPVVITRLDVSGKILETKGNINNAVPKEYYPVGMNVYELYPNLETQLTPVIKSQKNIRFQQSLMIDGKLRTFENHAFAIQNIPECELQIVIVGLDKTEDENVKEDLNRKNNELKAIFDAIPDLYFRLDQFGIVLDYKSDIEAELYVPPEVFLHKSIESFLPSNLSERVRASIEKVKKDRNLVTMEYVIPLGVHRRHFEARFFPLLNNEIIVIIREISDKVIFQEKILEKEKLLLETQRIAKVFSFFYDVQENIMSVTDEFKNISEIPDLKLENTPEYFMRIIYDEDRESVKKEFLSSFDYKMPDIYLEYRINTPSGEIKYILTEGRVKFDSKGKATQVLGLSQDITQRKNYEIELLTQRKELQGLLSNIEGIVQTQTLEVVQAKDRAEKASQAKSYFLANVSHELKTPIHAIMSFAELGIEKLENVEKSKVAEYFSIILESAKRLINLMTNILDLSKLESGNENFIFDKVNLYDLCLDICLELEAVITKKEMRINIEKPDTAIIIDADASKIGQVIRNLFSNSIRFSSEKSWIDVHFTKLDSMKKYTDSSEPGVALLIRDYGSGIENEDKELIFEKFRQGSQIKAGTGGTGLGLSISREIISGHRGIIFADNHPTGGAEFTIVLPLSQSNEI